HVSDVGRNNGAASRHFAAYEVRGQSFAQGDKLHLGRDFATLREGQLGDRSPATGAYPFRTKFRQSFRNVDTLRSAGVIDAKRRLAVRQRDLTHRDAHLQRAIDVDFL